MSYAAYDMCAARINARLDDDLAKKLEAVQRATKKSTTEVLREAIVRSYEEHVRDDGADLVRDAFDRTGFVGCAAGPVDLATEAKRYIAEDLRAKIGVGARRPTRKKRAK